MNFSQYKEIWQKIFDKFHNIVKYVSELRTKLEQQLIRDNTNQCYFPDKPTFEKENPQLFSYNINRANPIYPIISFQEYVINHINTMKISVDKSISIVQYNKFIRNMHNEKFKQKVFEKYEKKQYEYKMKNEIIRQIQSKKQNQLTMNLAPYFEYISKNGEIRKEPNRDDYQQLDKYRYYEDYTIWSIHHHM